jgi:hypothetical protein
MTGNTVNMDFSGKTFEIQHDGKRLRRQLEAVYEFMKAGGWWTLEDISTLTGYPQASISARLRDLRKPKFGSHVVNRRRRGHWSIGIFEYELLPSCNKLT